jgi:hypothetical protein
MKRVYFRGQPYEYRIQGDVIGKRQFALYKNGVLTHFVQEEDLDKRSLVSMVLDAYYRSIMNEQPSLLS